MRRGRLWQFIRNALVMSAAGIILRCVAVSFNVYLTEKLGAEGIGLYTLVMSVYGFGVTLATSGINLAATRLTAEAAGEGREGELGRAMRCCIGYSLFFGGLASVLLFLLAPFISTHWLEDGRTLPALRLLACSLLPVALTAALGGYFTGVRRVWKNASVQIASQGLRVFLTVNALQIFLPAGLEYACIGVVLGGTLAEFISFFLLWLGYVGDRRRHAPGPKELPPAAPIWRKLISIAVPVAVSTYARSFLLTLEHLLIPICLRKNGAGREASLAAYGTLHSMVMPILLFPSALLGAVSGLLIPEMAEYRADGRQAQIRRIAARCLRLTLIFSIGTAGIMSCHAYSLGTVIYQSPDAAEYIRLLAPLVPVMYLDGTVDAILKGLGEQVYSMNVNILDALLSVVLVLVLLPKRGVMGYVAVLYVCELFNGVCSLYRMLRITGVEVKVAGWVGVPLAAVVVATTLIHSFGGDCPAEDPFSLALRILLTGAVYLGILALAEVMQSKLRCREKRERRKGIGSVNIKKEGVPH